MKRFTNLLFLMLAIITVPTVSDAQITTADTSNTIQKFFGSSSTVTVTNTEAKTTRPDQFTTSAACLAALSSGNFRYYVPSFLKPLPLKAGEVRRPLEADACVHLWVVGKKAWVPQAAGTMYDFSGPTAIRRVDCGNKVYAVVYPRQEIVASATVSQPRTETIFLPAASRTDTVHSVQKIVVDRGPGFCSRNKAFCTLIGAAIIGGGGYLIYDAARPKEIENINCNINGSTKSGSCPIQKPASLRMGLNF